MKTWMSATLFAWELPMRVLRALGWMESRDMAARPGPAPGLARPTERSALIKRLASRVPAIICIVIGGVALTGWGLGVEFLKNPLPGQIDMKTNTALCFILGGLALLRPPRSAIVCASCVTAIALLTLAEHVLDSDLGIDQLLFREPPGAIGTVHPNRMAPNTALGFLLLGPALVLVAARRQAALAQGLALAAAAIATAALVGYLYGVRSLSGPLGFTHISPVSVLEMLILSFGVLLAGPDRGLMTALTNDTAGGLMARRLLPGRSCPSLRAC